MNKTILIILAILVVGLAAGYYFGYDHGWERAVQNESSSQIEQTKQDVERIDYHASFLIFTNGTKRVFTNPMYHNLSQDVYIEMANPAIVHVTKSGVTWGDFFETLPMELTESCLVTGTGERFCDSSSRKLKFYLNGQAAPDLLNQEIRDRDSILISYGVENQKQIDLELLQASQLLD